MPCSGNQSIDLRVVQKPLKYQGYILCHAPGTSLYIDLRVVQKPLKRMSRNNVILREPVYRSLCRSETTAMQGVEIMACSGNQSADLCFVEKTH
jgi:hypothetical protein